jgi:hypothetical protein
LPGLLQTRGDPAPAPAAVPGTVNQNESLARSRCLLVLSHQKIPHRKPTVLLTPYELTRGACSMLDRFLRVFLSFNATVALAQHPNFSAPMPYERRVSP